MTIAVHYHNSKHVFTGCIFCIGFTGTGNTISKENPKRHANRHEGKGKKRSKHHKNNKENYTQQQTQGKAPAIVEGGEQHKERRADEAQKPGEKAKREQHCHFTQELHAALLRASCPQMPPF